MAVLYVQHYFQGLDSNGDPLAGGKLYTYSAGTTTPKATYTTAAGTVPHANPIVLDSAGRATIFLDGSYKFTLKTSADVLVEETDNVTAFTTGGDISFSSYAAVSPATDDYALIGDTSDAGLAKKALLSDIVALVGAGSSSSAGYILLAEDTDNGVNTVKLISPSAVTSNRTQTLQDRDGTIMNTDQLRIGASASQSVPTVGAAAVQWTGGDGWLAITITNTQTGTNLVTKYVVMCDANSTPTHTWASGYFYGHSGANWSNGESMTLVFPIRNNDYYRIVETETVGATTPIVTEMNFRPLTTS